MFPCFVGLGRARAATLAVAVRAAARAALVAAVATAPVFADETLDPVVVTGARPPLAGAGGGLTVIDAATIARRRYRDLAEALSDAPGVYVAPAGGAGAQTSVFMRGAESDHVLVLIDGVEATDPSLGGLFSFEDFPLSAVERIEVLRGPRAARHGSGAVGGAINIVTRRGAGKPRAGLRLGAGGRGAGRAALDFSGARGALDYAVGVSHRRTDGESATARRARGPHERDERDGYRNTSMRLGAGLELGGLWRAEAGYLREDSRLEYDAGLRPFEDDNYQSRSSADRSTFALERAAPDGAWELFARAAHQLYRHNERCGAGAGCRRFDGLRDKYEVGGRRAFGDWNWSLGAETEQQRAKLRDGRRRAHDDAFHLLAEYAPPGAWSFDLGWRLDDPEGAGAEDSWRVSAAWSPRAGTRLHAAHGSAFRAPTLNERFGFAGNPRLESERVASIEFGARQEVAKFGALALTVFRMRLRDRIAYNFSSASLENAGRAASDGLEAEFERRFDAGGALRLNYSLISARDRDGDRRRLLRRPLRQGAAALAWPLPGGLSASARATHIGRRADVDRVTFARVRKGGYTLFDLALEWQRSQALAWHLRAENLFDKRHEPQDGYAGPGFGLYGGFELRM